MNGRIGHLYQAAIKELEHHGDPLDAAWADAHAMTREERATLIDMILARLTIGEEHLANPPRP